MFDPALTVSVAEALPLASKVTEFELSKQVGAPACAGCTEQASETGLSNRLSKLREIVEMAVCPCSTVVGLSADEDSEKSVPTLS